MTHIAWLTIHDSYQPSLQTDILYSDTDTDKPVNWVIDSFFGRGVDTSATSVLFSVVSSSFLSIIPFLSCDATFSFLFSFSDFYTFDLLTIFTKRNKNKKKNENTINVCRNWKINKEEFMLISYLEHVTCNLWLFNFLYF